MNAGQIVVLPPPGATQPVAGQASPTASTLPAGNQDPSAFAGVLRGASSHESARPTGEARKAKSAHAESSVNAEVNVAPAQPDTQPDVLATLQAMMGSGVHVEQPSDEKNGEDKQEADGARISPNVQLPQNVVLCAAESRIGAAQQINGRMPEAEQKVVDSVSERTPAAGVTALQPTSPLAVAPQVATGVLQKPDTQLDVASHPAPEKAVAGAVEPGRQDAAPVSETAGQATTPDLGLNAAVIPQGVPVAALAVQFVAPAPTAQTDLDADVRSVPAGSAFSAVPPQASTGTVGSTNPPQPGFAVADVRIVSKTATQQKVSMETVSTTDLPAASAPSELSADKDLPAVTGGAAPATPVRPNLDAYFQTSVRPSALATADSVAQPAQTAAPLPVMDTQPGTHSAVDSVQRPVRGEIRAHTELMAAEEQPVVRQSVAEGGAKIEVSAGTTAVGSSKEAASTASGEQFNRNGNAFGDQGMNGQAHLAMSHQVKQENVLPTAASPAVAANEASRTDSAEQIVSQVKEHLAGREIKTGTEQIVIRLSPENLGELKMNLRMENQRLKVEIVAETPMARDALMKHSDTLKESLARQNITMESFDVSTGGNMFGTASQGQGDWRELARQRQYNAWAPAGGYKLGAVPEQPIKPLYQASTAHSMVDVHF